MQTRAKADATQAPSPDPVQHEVVNLAAAREVPAAASLKTRLPYKVPLSWAARRCGVPLVTALAFLPTAARAQSLGENQEAPARIALAFFALLCCCFLSRRWRLSVLRRCWSLGRIVQACFS